MKWINMESNLLKDLSIRSRLAYGATCVEKCLEGRTVDSYLRKVIDKIWEFTSLDTLVDWLEEVREISPDSIVFDYEYFDPKDFTTLSESDVLGILQSYKALPEFILKMIDEVIDIGIAEMYGGIVGYSERTLESLLDIIRSMKENDIPLPELTPFLKSSFEEHGGWGNKNRRDFYR